jgi:hypothetical protein
MSVFYDDLFDNDTMGKELQTSDGSSIPAIHRGEEQMSIFGVLVINK